MTPKRTRSLSALILRATSSVDNTRSPFSPYALAPTPASGTSRQDRRVATVSRRRLALYLLERSHEVHLLGSESLQRQPVRVAAGMPLGEADLTLRRPDYLRA